MATRAKSGEFRKMMLGMKTKIPGKHILFLTQPLVGEFLNGSAVLADHEAMAAFHGI
jgi:hypothetical protein